MEQSIEAAPDLDTPITEAEAAVARPFAIEAIRELGVALSEDDRDEWLTVLGTAIVHGTRHAEVLALDALGRQLAGAKQREAVTCSPCMEHDHEGPPEEAPTIDGLVAALRHTLWHRVSLAEGREAAARIEKWIDLHGYRRSPQSPAPAVTAAMRSLAYKVGAVRGPNDAPNVAEFIDEVHATGREVEAELAQLDAGTHVLVEKREIDVLRAEREQYLNADKAIDRARHDRELAIENAAEALGVPLFENDARRDYALVMRETTEAAKRVEKLRDERDALKAEVERLTRERDEARGRLREHAARAVRLDGELARLRFAAPTAQSVDVEAAAKQIAADSEREVNVRKWPLTELHVAAVLAKHTRKVAVEDVARAVYPLMTPFGDFDSVEPEDRGQALGVARAALTALSMKPKETASAEADDFDSLIRESLDATEPLRKRELAAEGRTVRSDPREIVRVDVKALALRIVARQRAICMSLNYEGLLETIRHVAAPASAPGFVVDREKVRGVFRDVVRMRHWHATNADAEEFTDRIIAEYERQRAEHEKNTGAGGSTEGRADKTRASSGGVASASPGDPTHPAAGVEPGSPAPASPAASGPPKARESSAAQRDAAWRLGVNLLRILPLNDTGVAATRAQMDEACAAVAHVAPAFVEPIALPRATVSIADEGQPARVASLLIGRETVVAALKAQGLRVAEPAP